MKTLRAWFLYGLALVAVAALAFAARSDDGQSSPVPSTVNPSGPGLRAVYLYLAERGAPVRPLESSYEALPGDARVLVTTASVARSESPAEVRALEAFVRRGGTLVYLTSPRARRPRLERWLGAIDSGPLDGDDDSRAQLAEDPFGTSVEVWRPFRALAGATQLRLQRQTELALDAPDAVPVAGRKGVPAMWWRGLGRGELWLASVALGENRRIELEDNLAFWANLASLGPVYFDEWHHQAEPLPPVSRGLWAIALQLVACTLVFALARGTRLGPARPEPPEQDRSSLEYLQSFAWLTRRAGVEKELLPALVNELRVHLHEGIGIPITWPHAEVARRLQEERNLPAERYLSWIAAVERTAAQPRVRAGEYAALAREGARLGRWADGASSP